MDHLLEIEMQPGKLLTPRWIITTLFVIAAVFGMVRLGFWQLNRLEERREFNARVLAQVNAPPIDLPSEIPDDAAALFDMDYRKVTARGIYIAGDEILLRNQVRDGMPGFDLITPLRLSGTDTTILVDRGFIPMSGSDPEQRKQYEQSGEVVVTGILRRPVIPRFAGVPDPTLTPGQTRLDSWNAIRIDRIQSQVEGQLLPVYLQAAPPDSQSSPPYASLEQPELSEGPHMGYALQWFSFAMILAIGYPLLVRKQLRDHPGSR
jgi:surfeit locus 1 family protein